MSREEISRGPGSYEASVISRFWYTYSKQNGSKHSTETELLQSTILESQHSSIGSKPELMGISTFDPCPTPSTPVPRFMAWKKSKPKIGRFDCLPRFCSLRQMVVQLSQEFLHRLEIKMRFLFCWTKTFFAYPLLMASLSTTSQFLTEDLIKLPMTRRNDFWFVQSICKVKLPSNPFDPCPTIYGLEKVQKKKWLIWILTSILRLKFLFKTDSGYLRDAEVTWFTLANPEHSLRFNTHWSAPPVSALARSGGPMKMSQSLVSRN